MPVRTIRISARRLTATACCMSVVVSGRRRFPMYGLILLRCTLARRNDILTYMPIKTLAKHSLCIIR